MDHVLLFICSAIIRYNHVFGIKMIVIYWSIISLLEYLCLYVDSIIRPGMTISSHAPNQAQFLWPQIFTRPLTASAGRWKWEGGRMCEILQWRTAYLQHLMSSVTANCSWLMFLNCTWFWFSINSLKKVRVAFGSTNVWKCVILVLW